MSQGKKVAKALQQGFPTINEKERLSELHSLDVLDTPADKYLDRYTRLVAEIIKVPIAAVSLIGEHYQSIKSAVGLKVGRMPLEESFCVHALSKNMLEIPDTTKDDNFSHHPLVIAPPFIRFYMGTVLRGPTGQPLGTLHIMDTEPRLLSQMQRSWLVTFGHVAEELINRDQGLSDVLNRAQKNNNRNTLTNLPDQTLFLSSLKHLIQLAERENNHLAVLHLRLNKIDEISRVYGRPTSNNMVCRLAERLCAPNIKTLAVGHLGKNSLAAVIELPSLNQIFDLVRPITNTLTRPLEVMGTMLKPDIDMSVSLFPMDGHIAEDLLEHAVAALEGPKSQAGIYVFSHEVEQQALRRAIIEQHLDAALSNHEMTKHFQPLVTVDGSRIVGFEALARWHHPALGDLSPGDFVPIAEKNPRLSKMLSDWSLKVVACGLPQWPFKSEDPPLRIAINISPDQFLTDGFVERVLQTLDEYRMPPERLTLELTEEGILADIDKSILIMHAFRCHGIHISLDDFGTGYSSLRHIKDLPLDTLKIDKSFIDDLTNNARSANLVSGIIRIAHDLDLQVVAEGVEHEAQRALLQEFGCDVIQGYLFSHPLPANEAMALLKNWLPARKK